MAAVALLLPAGVLAATTAGEPSSSAPAAAGGRVPTLPGGQPAPPMIYGPGAINACVVIGRPTAAKTGC